MPTMMELIGAQSTGISTPMTPSELMRLNAGNGISGATPYGGYSGANAAIPGATQTSVPNTGIPESFNPASNPYARPSSPIPSTSPLATLGDSIPSTLPGSGATNGIVPTAGSNIGYGTAARGAQSGVAALPEALPSVGKALGAGIKGGIYGATVGAALDIAAGTDPTEALVGAAGGLVGGVLGGVLLGGLGGLGGSYLGSMGAKALLNAFRGNDKPIGDGRGASGTRAPIPVELPPGGVAPDGRYRLDYTLVLRFEFSNGAAPTVNRYPAHEELSGSALAQRIRELATAYPGTPHTSPSAGGGTETSYTNLTGVGVSEVSPGTQPKQNPFANPSANASPLGAFKSLDAPAPLIQPYPSANPNKTPSLKPGLDPVTTPKTPQLPALDPSLLPALAPLLPLLSPKFSPTGTPQGSPTSQPGTTASPSPLAPGGATASTPKGGTFNPATGTPTTPKPIEETQKPPVPDKTTTKGEDCCKQTGESLEDIKRVLGISEFPGSLPILTGDEQVAFKNIPELIIWIARCIDSTSGQFPTEIKILDANSVEKKIKLENMSHAIEELFAALVIMAQDADAAVNIGARVATEVINTKIAVQQGNDILKAVQRFLGFTMSVVPRIIKMNFTPSAAGIDNKLQNQEMEEFLKPSTQNYIGHDLGDNHQLLPMLQRTLNNSEIVRAAHWHPIKPNAKGEDSITGTRLRKSKGKPTKGEQKSWEELLGILKKMGVEVDEKKELENNK